eukprot:scaffold652429_cov42-Prasinocladus_malaysianus.AAC.1
MINRDYIVGTGGLDAAPPSRPARGLFGNILGKKRAPLPAPALSSGEDPYSESYEDRAVLVDEPEVKLEYFTRPFGTPASH